MTSAENYAAIDSMPRTGINFSRIWEEAKSRWLRPKEIYDILNNYCDFVISTETPNLPPSGTLILFDRKMLRNFRKDGHSWRKKKDNKTVKEAHEHLKVGSEEKIHVYYAHGEGASNLQRRVYWLLDKDLEHIVLVHYLQVKEGNRVNTEHTWQQNSLEDMQEVQQNQAFRPLNSSSFATVEPMLDSESSVDQLDFSKCDPNEDFDTFSIDQFHSLDASNMDVVNASAKTHWQLHSMHLEGKPLVEGLDGSATKGVMSTLDYTNFNLNGSNVSGMATLFESVSAIDMGQQDAMLASDGEESYIDSSNKLSWQDISSSASTMPIDVFNYDAQHSTNLQRPVVIDSTEEGTLAKASADSQCTFEIQVTSAQSTCSPLPLASNQHTEDMSCGNRDENVPQWSQNVGFNVQITLSESNTNIQVPLFESQNDDGEEVLRKLDSLDRWMQRELPGEHNSPLPVSIDSCSYLGAPLINQCQSKTGDVSNLAWQDQLSEELTPSFPPQLFFEITDFTPAWSFSSDEAKVIVTGRFVGDLHDFLKVHWCCMFGDIEVPAEVVQPGVLRCKAPKVGPALVPFCITDGTRQACSDVKEFEFRGNPQSPENKDHSTTEQFVDDMTLQIRFAQLLLSKSETTAMSGQKMSTETTKQEWDAIEKLVTGPCFDPCELKEQLLQMFFKQKLLDFISDKSRKDGKSLRAYDKSGQGLLHLASALGYEWIIGSVMASGMSIDFRDKRGWTALHWAAYYGREKMIAALLAAGAKPGMVSDPTRENPYGCSPADVAASTGNAGIAGYLSECELKSRLELLTLSENEQDKQFASEQGHRTREYLRRSASLQRSVKTFEDELSLEDSLSAVANATTAAARIHAAFREHSFRERLRAIEEVDEYGLLPEENHVLAAAQKIQRAYRNHREQKIKESAALQIQNGYRVWKSRKDYLNLRQKVIKIQAYFRMHRARRHYHKIIWSVGILEKAILRWRQKRKGLQGFQAEITVPTEEYGEDDFLKIGRKQAEEALDRSVVRVQAMVRSRLARQQYRQMLENFKAKVVELDHDAWKVSTTAPYMGDA